MSASYSYAPGDALAICGPRVAALIDLPADAGLVPGLYELIGSPEGTLDEVLELLVTPGLRAIQHFALAEPTDDGLRVLVRGRFQVNAGDHTIEGHGLWTDRIVQADGFALLDPEAPASGFVLPLPGGVALAGRLSSAGGAPASRPAPAPAQSPTPPPAGQQSDAAVPPPPPAGSPVPVPVPPAEPAAPELDPRDAEESTEPDQGVAAPDGGSGHTLPTPFTSPVAALPVAVSPSPSSPSVEPSPSAPPPPSAPSTPPAGGQPTFIDSLPWHTPDLPPGTVQPPAAQAQPAPPSGDQTISRDSLPRDGMQTVVAARCPAGHLSPAYAGSCRVCGQPLPPQQPVEIPRPPLGVLNLSNGDTVVLDRGCILGRNPRVPTPLTGERPNLVTLVDPDKDISGQHLEVRLEYWHVAVKDLGSTNGTQVVLPGESPITLRPNDPMMIEPGTKVILAGVFSFTFEVTP